MKNNKEMTSNEEEEEEEPMFLVGLECSHSQILSASKPMKPMRRDHHHARAAYFLCSSCYRRERGACSIDPVHRVRSITEIPPSLLKRYSSAQELRIAKWDRDCTYYAYCHKYNDNTCKGHHNFLAKISLKPFANY
jgi:hypothetical protein